MARKPETIAFWRGRLPHWEVVDGRYFVTLHLAGAIPKQGYARIHAQSAELGRVAKHDQEAWLAIQRRIFAEMENWLDRAEQIAHLRQPDVARTIMEAIAFRRGRDWNMFEFVVMPNHVHLFFELVNGVGSGRSAEPRRTPAAARLAAPTSEGRLKVVLEQFKRWTGHEAAKWIDLSGGRLWQDEWFDHWSRSDEEDERICEYIRRNPEKAKLVNNYLDWPLGSWVEQVGAASRAAPRVRLGSADLPGVRGLLGQLDRGWFQTLAA
jgi:putative transposase